MTIATVRNPITLAGLLGALVLSACQDTVLPTAVPAPPSLDEVPGECVVTSLADAGGAGTLRVLLATTECNSITFGVTGTIQLTSESLVIDRPLTITGPDAPGIIVRGAEGCECSVFVITPVNEQVTIDRVTITNGSGEFGGGIDNTGGALLTLSRSTVSGNSARLGGGIASVNRLTLSNSTISGNSSEGSGGGIYADLRVILSSSTVTANVGGGGGISANFNRGALTLHNSIVSGNSLPDVQADEPLIVNSLVGVAALLGPLADNGGPTWTHALLPGSPAIDTGLCTDADGGLVTTDQRGVSRPQGNACDIGAFERQEAPACSGVEIGMRLAAGPDPIAPGENGSWTVEVAVSACEDVTEVSAQGGTAGWATTSDWTTATGSIAAVIAKKNTVLQWSVGDLSSGTSASASFVVAGAVGRKAACDTLLELTGEWSATATAASPPDASPVKYDQAGPVTVRIGC